jgi:Secretion system C-terminal sorting domain
MCCSFPTFSTFLHYYNNKRQTLHSQTGFTAHPLIKQAVTVFFVSLKTLKNMNNMKKNLLIASLLLSGAASAQFTQANEPSTGVSQAMYELEETADPYANATGAGQTWDYSSYFGFDNSPRTLSITTAAANPEGANFPNAQKAISIEGFITTFISSTASTRNSEGFSYEAGAPLGTVNVVLNTNNGLLMNYPMALSNSLVDAYAGTAYTSSGDFPTTGNSASVVDGEGTLILNGSTTYTGVLRYKLIDTADADAGLFGPVQIVRTQYEYYKLGSNQNMPLFIHSTLELSLFPEPTVVVLSSVAPDGYLSVNTNELAGLTVYPNPATETISVKGLTADAQLTLVDAQGKTVANKAVEAGFASMDINAVTAGVYFLHITSNDQTTVERVVVR